MMDIKKYINQLILEASEQSAEEKQFNEVKAQMHNYTSKEQLAKENPDLLEKIMSYVAVNYNQWDGDGFYKMWKAMPETEEEAQQRRNPNQKSDIYQDIKALLDLSQSRDEFDNDPDSAKYKSIILKGISGEDKNIKNKCLALDRQYSNLPKHSPVVNGVQQTSLNTNNSTSQSTSATTQTPAHKPLKTADDFFEAFKDGTLSWDNAVKFIDTFKTIPVIQSYPKGAGAIRFVQYMMKQANQQGNLDDELMWASVLQGKRNHLNNSDRRQEIIKHLGECKTKREFIDKYQNDWKVMNRLMNQSTDPKNTYLEVHIMRRLWDKMPNKPKQKFDFNQSLDSIDQCNDIQELLSNDNYLYRNIQMNTSLNSLKSFREGKPASGTNTYSMIYLLTKIRELILKDPSKAKFGNNSDVNVTIKRNIDSLLPNLHEYTADQCEMEARKFHYNYDMLKKREEGLKLLIFLQNVKNGDQQPVVQNLSTRKNGVNTMDKNIKACMDVYDKIMNSAQVQAQAAKQFDDNHRKNQMDQKLDKLAYLDRLRKQRQEEIKARQEKAGENPNESRTSIDKIINEEILRCLMNF